MSHCLIDGPTQPNPLIKTHHTFISFLSPPHLCPLALALGVANGLAQTLGGGLGLGGGGLLLHLTDAEPPLPLLGGLALGGAFGVLAGNRLAQYFNSSLLQRLFALMLVTVSLSLGIQKLVLGH